jgi:serine/threonine-protein kinase SRPK3
VTLTSPASLPLHYRPNSQELPASGRAGFEADIQMVGWAIFEIRASFTLFERFLGGDDDILKQTVETLGRLLDPWRNAFEERAL